MSQQERASHDVDEEHEPARAQAKAKEDGVKTRHPGGKDGLGRKENVLAPFYDEMVEVAHELAGQFTPLGLHFRPEILLATAMQEASATDPLNARSFDNGLGIMQITPYNGKLDPAVARSIGWDNTKGVEYNVQHSRWRDARSNLRAGAFTMLGKAKSIKGGVPRTWEQMNEAHRWRAVLFAYNAGEGSAIRALRSGGPNAPMISTFTVNGRRVSHDYTAEIKAKLDYVNDHDPFGPGGPEATDDDKDKDKDDPHPGKPPAAHVGIKGSVGRGGANHTGDVREVQTRLTQRGADPKGVDGIVGPNTIHAIEVFQHNFLPHPDGLIEPGHITEKHLFGEHGKIPSTTHPKHKPDKGPSDSKDKGDGKEEPDADAKEHSHPSYAAISKNFHSAIPGSHMTWHQALYLPSWGRHAKPSDVSNTSMDTVLANIEKQAAALTRVSNHFGKPIRVHCWLRPPAYNRQIGGASNSAHLRGMATDFHLEGISAEQVRKEIKSHHGLYPGAGENNVSWVHLDLEHHSWFNP